MTPEAAEVCERITSLYLDLLARLDPQSNDDELRAMTLGLGVIILAIDSGLGEELSRDLLGFAVNNRLNVGPGNN